MPPCREKANNGRRLGGTRIRHRGVGVLADLFTASVSQAARGAHPSVPRGCRGATTLKIGEFRLDPRITTARHARETTVAAVVATVAAAAARRDYTNRRPTVADCLANRIVQPNNYCLAVTGDCIALQ